MEEAPGRALKEAGSSLSPVGAESGVGGGQEEGRWGSGPHPVAVSWLQVVGRNAATGRAAVCCEPRLPCTLQGFLDPAPRG